MRRLALVALPLAVFGLVLFAFVLVMRRRRDSAATETPPGETEAADGDLDRAPTPAGIDVLSGYDEEHETELEARHGATLHITENRLSFRQV